jgi:hypothetical protein
MLKTQVMSPQLELAFTKSIEMICEDIPGTCTPNYRPWLSPLTPPIVGTVLQIFALFKANGKGNLGRMIASAVISALTTGVCSATISYDFE